MKTTAFKYDGSHKVQLSQGTAAFGGWPIPDPAGLGIRRAHPGHVRSTNLTKLALQCALLLLLWPALATQAATTVTHIAAGGSYSLFLKSDGSLWGMGDNYWGELGDGATNNLINTPEEIVSNDVIAVAAGWDFSLFVKSDGSLWGMGDNSWGQLGDGMTNDAHTPVEIVSNGVVAAAAGYDHSLFVKSDGSLWAMGDNYYGQLGDGTFNSTNKPEEFVSNNVVAVAAAAGFSLFIKSDGSLWGVGDTYYGQLGDRTISTNGIYYFYGISTPEEIVSNGVVAVAAGGDFSFGGNSSLFIKSDGSLWGMGDNLFGQLGFGTFYDTNKPVQIVSRKVVAVAAGGAYSLFVKSDGSLWGMGDNSSGQLGDGTFTTYPNEAFHNYATLMPEEIVSNGVVAVAAEGGGIYEASSFGGDSYPAHSLFLKADGSLWAMGADDAGQLGDGFNYDSLLPEQIVPHQPVLASPVLGANVGAQTVTNIAAGDNYSLWVTSGGSLWAMGDNSSGQLGDGTTNTAYTPEQIVSSDVVAAATGEYYAEYYSTAYPPTPSRLGLFSLFVKSDGSLWAMGDNYFGQLGDGTFNSTNQPEEIVSNGVVAVAGGDDYSLFVKSDGSLWGMGDNELGQFGDGSFQVSTNYPYGISTPEEIVSNGVVAVAAGGDIISLPDFLYSEGHSLFLKSDGSLWGMGDNGYGELGDASFTWTNRPALIVSNAVVAVAAGIRHSLFIKSDGSLWGMGYNADGELGDGTTNNAYVPEEIVSNGVVAVAAGYDHSLFVKSDGSLWGMGDNSWGQLGDGTTNDAHTPVEIVSNDVVAAAAGDYHSLFLTSDGSLWGMGDNSAGELGNGSRSSLVPEKLAGGPWLRGTCFAGGTYRLLSSTDAALPVSQWTPVWTNTIAHRGPNNFSAPLPDDLLSHDRQRFYLLQSR